MTSTESISKQKIESQTTNKFTGDDFTSKQDQLFSSRTSFNRDGPQSNILFGSHISNKK